MGSRWQPVGRDEQSGDATIAYVSHGAPFDDLLRLVAEEVERAVAAVMGIENVDTPLRQQIISDVRIIVEGYGPRSIKDVMYNEVLMFDDVTFNIDHLLAVGVFPQFAPDVGHFWCWGSSHGIDFNSSSTLACAIRSETEDRSISTTDIFLRRSKLEGDLLTIPGGDVDVDQSDVQFNRCADATAIAYPVLVHEVGHALGIRSGDVGSGSDTSHPTMITKAVMYGGLNDETGCSPNPIDVMALYAIYQSR